MTTSTDLSEEIHHLRGLADGFKALHHEVLALAVTPGTEALDQLRPLLLKSQELVGKALLRLSALNGSPYAEVSGSRHTLTAFRTLVAGASLASDDLARAVAANPLDGISFGGPHQDEDATRQARHDRALPEIAGYLADAAHQLDACKSDCLYLAKGIVSDLERSSSTSAKQAAHKLSSSQYAAVATPTVAAKREGRR
ncbi:hypothetical protein [Streptomyces lydicus]|uniref:hypothetical protein n=1 Tax=Streptomyces lydicus TaxID=47763 RepID=UPI0010117998|nr:hypothetical protein [Streptomyces lydicus]MCZ1006868.1 hypothetical protein [Streptomyces lydicus]